MNKAKKAFTLVELLVVISIIALLLAILMPSLNKAREAGKTIVCGSHLKQFGIALQTYSRDNSNAYLVHEWQTPGESDLAKSIERAAWITRISPYLSTKAKLQTGELMRCPSGMAIREFGKKLVWGWFTTDYGLQDLGQPQTQAELASGVVRPVNIDSIQQPGDFSTFFDFYFGCQSENASAPLQSGAITCTKFYDVADNKRKLYASCANRVFRHSKNINALYLDGHIAKAQRRQKVWMDLDSKSSRFYDSSGDSYAKDRILK